jgi:hypothetical protein
MPLPSVSKFGARRCESLNRRTKERCKNPAAFGCKVCRYHGAHHIKRGEQASNYVHGAYTQEAQKASSIKICELRYLENIAHASKIINGNKTSGRKPKGYSYFLSSKNL